MMAAIDPVVSLLIEKLTDGNARIRDGVKKGLQLLSSVNCVGPAVVAVHALRTLTPKEKTAWKPLHARLQVLFDLVNGYGVGGNTGLTTETVMGFMKTYGAFAHSNGEVRESAKLLTIAIQHRVGTDALMPYLEELRAVQKKEYLSAFKDDGSAVDGGASPDAKKSGGNISNNHVTHNPGGKVNTSVSKADDKYQSSPDVNQKQNSKNKSNSESKAEGKSHPQHSQQDPGHQGGGEEGEEDFTCPFCSAGDESWDENQLDLHYLKDCPMLAPCPACAQVLALSSTF